MEELIETPQEETTEEVIQQEAAPEPKPVSQENQENIRALRKAHEQERRERERERQERERAEQELAALKKQLEVAQQPKQPDTFGLDPDDYASGKHVNQLYSYVRNLEEKIAKKEAEEAQYKKEQMVTSAETRLKASFNDFDKVVSEENLEILERDYPEIMQTIRSSGDIYNKGAAAYKIIRNMGIYQDDKYVASKSQAQNNMYKPRPTTSINPQQGNSPLENANAFANGLTPDLQAKLWKEMQDAEKYR